MDIDISYIKELADAIAYNSSSTNSWAENRLKELKSKILSGEPIVIRDNESSFIIKTLEDLIELKNRDPYLATISLADKKDNFEQLRLLNQKLEELKITGINTYHENGHVKQVYTNAGGSTFTCTFLFVKGYSFPENLRYVRSVFFRLSFQDEIEEMNKLYGDSNGHIVLTADIDTLNGKLTPGIACKEVEF